jgi:carbamoyl-phosphate synthase large subunit
LILPLQDKATVALASVKFPSTVTVITSSAEANAICLDKRKFEQFVLNDAWLKEFYPAVHSTSQDKVICKPVQGSNSQGITVCDKTAVPLSDPEHWILQDYIANGTEISVDAYFNRQSQLVDLVPRVRLAVQGGEVSKSQTLERHAYGLYELTKLLGEKIGLTGPGCFQYILDSQEFPFIMEVNARFGGGVILSLESGLDFIELIKKEYVLGETVPSQPYSWRVGFGMNRYFSEFFYA